VLLVATSPSAAIPVNRAKTIECRVMNAPPLIPHCPRTDNQLEVFFPATPVPVAGMLRPVNHFFSISVTVS
jgi:uncharacterized membrane protein